MGSSIQSLNKNSDLEKWLFPKWKLKKKKSQSENSCVYTNRAKWKTEAITQMTLIQSSRQLKYTEN